MSAPDSTSDSIKRLLPWLVAVAFFMESLDTTILNTAVPTIAAALGVAPLSMKSVLSSYTLSLRTTKSRDSVPFDLSGATPRISSTTLRMVVA